MSRWHGVRQRCPSCKLRYGQFKTGLTYRDVWDWLRTEGDDSSTWRYKRRNTVLGKWHQHKLELWELHKRECRRERRWQRREARRRKRLGLEDVPF